jgi:hypothetical protein
MILALVPVEIRSRSGWAIRFQLFLSRDSGKISYEYFGQDQ